MNVVYLINHTFVGIFGMVLSAAFCEIVWTKRKRRILIGGMAVLLAFQGIVYFCVSEQLARYLYPVTTHVPLMIMLYILSKKGLWSVISVFTAYLCCQIRRWLALLVIAIFSGGVAMQKITELVVTLPLLFFLVYFAAPSVRCLSHYPVLVQCQFGLIPVLYYGFDYLTVVYTNMLLDGSLAAVEFMPFVCCVAYLIFVLHISAAERARIQLEQAQDVLNVQITQAVREIEALREAQQKTKVYRHDLRHHVQYLSSCLENGKIQQAQAYVHKIYSEIEADKMMVFCENEAANLIFSSFVGRANNQDIAIKINAVISPVLPISESDLCVLLSNALENALHACQKCREKGLPAMIEVSAYEKNWKFFLQIINSCDTDVRFVHGIPITNRSGHGMGVRSICTMVERYNGMYTFLVEDDRFILRISL